MIKTFKKAISIFLIVSFVLSLVPVVSFAAHPAHYQSVASYPWTGDNVPSARMVSSAGTAVNVTTFNADKKKTIAVLEYEDGCYGKVSSDAVYHTFDYSTRQSISISNNGDFTTTPSSTIKSKDIVLEFSFAYDKAGANNVLVQSSYRFFKTVDRLTTNSTTYGYVDNSLVIRTDGVKFNASKTSAPATVTVESYDFKPHTWYNVALVFDVENKDVSSDANEASYVYKVYVNGELISQKTEASRYYGLNTMRTLPALNADMYWDNINLYATDDADSFDCSAAKEAELVSAVSNIEVDSAADVVSVPKGTKISELKAALSTSSASAVRYYNSDYTAQLNDTDEAMGANVVVATYGDHNGVSREKTYSHYKVDKFIYRYPGINNGTKEIAKYTSGKSEWYRMSSVSENLGGKGDDEYLLSADSSGVSRKITLEGAEGGTQDVFEMSFYVPSNSKGISITPKFTSIAGKAVELPLLIKGDGIYTNWGNASKFHTLEPDRWYNFALVSPDPYVDSAAENTNKVKIYINGEVIDDRAVTYTYSGFRDKFLMGSLGNDANHAPVIYLDNIRIHSNEYAPQYDALDYIDYKDGIDKNNNIIVKGKTTVGQLKADIIKKEDTTIRVYKNISSTEILSDGAIVEDGYVVVAAAKNDSEMERSYNYYTVKRIKNEVKVTTYVDGAVARTYGSDAQSLSVSADFYNYTNSDLFTAKMYVAQYKYGELINLWQADAKTIAAGEKETFTCNFEGIKDLENSNIKIMLVDENLNPYSKAATMRYKGTDSQATLYLMGDSIVQTYVNEKYPIQGWGYYIGDYLDDNITVDNRARSGWTTDHYLHPDGVYTKENGLYPVGTQLYDNKGNPKKPVGEGDRYRVWENIKKTLKAGDYVMVSLGINDSGSGNVSAERYRENIETIYNEAAVIGATVIFTTPTITGRDWNSTGGFREEYTGKGDICQAVADANNSVCLPLGAELIKTYNAMVNEYQQANPEATTVEAKNYVRNYFHLYGASSTNPPPGWEDFGSKTTDDDMHHNFVGSNKVASIIAKLLAQSDSPLGDYVVFPN